MAFSCSSAILSKIRFSLTKSFSLREMIPKKNDFVKGENLWYTVRKSIKVFS
jgi:hypothetical protein